jgi:hypothetical protein
VVLLHPIEIFVIFLSKFVLLGMIAAPLAEEFGISTWYKYLAGLSNSSFASEGT